MSSTRSGVVSGVLPGVTELRNLDEPALRQARLGDALVESDVARERQSNRLNSMCDGGSLRDGHREPPARPQTVTKIPKLLSLSFPPGATGMRPVGLS
jgi:hypothetical protein